jgi:hypothetical protein
MTTDFRALCARLVHELENTQKSLMYHQGCSAILDSIRCAVVDRARAALAAEPGKPIRLRRVCFDMPSTIAECGGPCSDGGPEACDCGALWRDEPVAEAEPPANGEVAETVKWLREEAQIAWTDGCPVAAGRLTRAADLLERLVVPLPGDPPATEESAATQPAALALRVQKLEAVRETEKAAVLDLYQQIDRLKRRQDWQYTKIGRLEDAAIKADPE